MTDTLFFGSAEPKQLDTGQAHAPMPGTDNLAERFHKLFAGNKRFHGQTTRRPPRTSSRKVEVDCRTIKSPPSSRLWQSHLEGQQRLGISPLRDDGTVRFAAVDVDDYELLHETLIGQLARHSLPLIVCRSKSGGAHLYLFFKEPVPAASAREFLGKVVRLLGLKL